jgi:pilus assembly protein Flp/PilA
MSILYAITLVTRTIVRAWRETRAATAIEYGLILALVVIAMFVGLIALADSTTGLWNNVATEVTKAR